MHATPLILADRGCPYTHRVLSLLAHLGVAHESREAPFGQLPEGLERWSPSGRIPLLVHGELVLGESRVMLEHLAEVYGFESAYPAELALRTRHRHAMAIVDAFFAPKLFREDAGLDESRLSEYADILEGVARATPAAPSLLAFQVAPFWLRFEWWRPQGAVTRAIRRRSALADWLDAVVQLPSVARTSPDRAEHIAEFQVICAARG